MPDGSNRVLALYQKLGDNRADLMVREAWTAASAKAADHESLVGWQRKQAMATWRAWRAQAAAVLGELGFPATAEFLTEQAKATTDPVVARACRDAARAIKRRKK
jgi:HEAT repeat protein